jgi:hypothetical protein
MFTGLPPSSSDLAERKALFRHLLLQIGGANIENPAPSSSLAEEERLRSSSSSSSSSVRRRAISPTLAAVFEPLALLGSVKSQFVHVEDSREPIAQRLVHVDHERVIDVVPGLNDLQLRFGLGQPVHHVDLEQ